MTLDALTPRFTAFAAGLIGAMAAGGCVSDRLGDAPASGPEVVYLTWQRDPTTTMTVQWVSGPGATGEAVAYGQAGEDFGFTTTASHHPLPYTNRVVHVAELAGLEPGRDYGFRIAGSAESFAFRTMPEDASEPITFAIGGDIYRDALPERLIRLTASRDPAFVILGGDIAYDNGERGRVGRWVRLLEAWQKLMVAPGGRLIPIVVAIGNHEVRSRYDATPDEAAAFYGLFAAPGPGGCTVLDFGSYMSIVVLDSGHTHPIGGEQTAWLEAALSDRAGVEHLFAVYHVPAFPSVRSFDEGKSPVIREHWVPLFERYGLDVAFEHHDHAYKRTHPIREGRVDAAGVVYLGDGSWGANPRGVHSVQRTWYLARAESVNNVIVTPVHGEHRRFTALDPDGQVIDEWPPGAAAAASDASP